MTNMRELFAFKYQIVFRACFIPSMMLILMEIHYNIHNSDLKAELYSHTYAHTHINQIYCLTMRI